MLIHFDDYLKEIKGFVLIAKTGDRSRFIQKTTVVSLRNYCLFLFNEGLSSADEQNFRLFFQINKEDDLGVGIKKMDTDKLRPIKNYLDGKTETPNQDNIEMIAILLDFKPRPFSKFSKSNLSEVTADEFKNKEEIQLFKEEQKETIVSVDRKEQGFVIDKPKSNLKKRVGIGIVSLLGLFSISYTAKDMLFPEKQCMVWKGNHFEMIDCQTEGQGIASYEDIKPYDANDYQLVKLKVCDTTTFFVGPKAIVWYCKMNGGEPEYFNHSGFHPESGKPLRPITPYIIKKYVEPCK